MTDDVMHAHEFLPGLGKALTCVISTAHRPVPFRYVWHHILPQVCGGETVLSNLVSVCDNCHFTIHALMYALRENQGIFTNRHGNAAQRYLALQGYSRAVNAGTVGKLPNEGGGVFG